MVEGFTTEDKVSLKSNTFYCEYPFATSLALYLRTEPSEFFLLMYVYLHPIIFLCVGKDTRSQVLFFINALYSSFMAALQLLSCTAY